MPVSLITLGVSHNSAPVALLDRIGMTEPTAAAVRDEIVRSPYIAEVMVVATCNRIEVIADVDRFHGAVADITEVLANSSGLAAEELTPHLYAHFEEQAVAHLFQVAAGLDSMVVGEQQIIGQTRAALRAAQEAGTASRVLNAVGQRALRVAKRVHAETGIDRCGASVVSVAIELAKPRVGEPAHIRALVIGAGAMSSLAVSQLAQAGVGELVVANRTLATAQRLRQQYGAHVIPLTEVAGELARADLIVTATGSVGLVITKDDLSAARRGAHERPLTVIDLAVPHDTEPAIADLPGVCRIDLSTLALSPQAQASAADIDLARKIIETEVADFLAEQVAHRVDPVVVSLRAKADVVVEAELSRLRAKLSHLSERDATLVERSLRRAVSTLLHTPTVRMKQFAAGSDGHRYAEVLHRLFDLDAAPVSEIPEPQPGAVGDLLTAPRERDDQSDVGGQQ